MVFLTGSHPIHSLNFTCLLLSMSFKRVTALPLPTFVSLALADVDARPLGGKLEKQNKKFKP